MDLTKDQFSIFITWKLVFSIASDSESEIEAAISFVTWPQKSYATIATILYWLHRLALFSMGEYYKRAWKLGGGTHSGSSLEAGYQFIKGVTRSFLYSYLLLTGNQMWSFTLQHKDDNNALLDCRTTK